MKAVTKDHILYDLFVENVWNSQIYKTREIGMWQGLGEQGRGGGDGYRVGSGFPVGVMKYPNIVVMVAQPCEETRSH